MSRRLRQLAHDNGGVASIAVFFALMVLLFSLITSTFLTEGNLLNILRQIAPLMIVAVAMTFVITTAGIDRWPPQGMWIGCNGGRPADDARPTPLPA